MNKIAFFSKLISLSNYQFIEITKFFVAKQRLLVTLLFFILNMTVWGAVGDSFTYFEDDTDYFDFKILDEGSKTCQLVNGYTYSDGELVIPDIANGYRIVSISSNALSNCTKLTKLVLPEGLLTIESSAFEYCATLIHINLPSTLQSIGSAAFRYCSALEEISIPNGITILTTELFANCNSLRKVILPSSLTTINEGAFRNCSSLSEVNLPSSITTMGWCVFSGCSSLTNIEIPSSLTVIEQQTFEGCSGLTSIKLPETINRIGGGAFSWCTSLKSIQLPNSLVEMSDAFNGCTSLETIAIPKSVRSASSFIGCISLQSIVVDEDNPWYDSRENCNAIIETAKNKLIAGCTNTVIPLTITAIGPNAFAGFEQIEEIIIPDGVVEIGFDAFNGTGWYEKQPIGMVYAGNVFYCFKQDKDGVYVEKDNYTTLSLKEGTIGIADYAFGGFHELTSLIIPEGVTHIGEYAFNECRKLSDISFPSSIKYIRGYSGITQTPWYSQQEDGLIYIGHVLLSYKGNMHEDTSIDVAIGTEFIGASAFAFKKKLKSVNLPATLKIIGGTAFQGSGLSSISIPQGVSIIEEGAFASCGSLSDVDIPSSIVYIEWQAFAYASFGTISGLKNLTVRKKCPIPLYDNIFPTRSNVTLYVPIGCKTAYENADIWKEFKEILEVELLDNEPSENINVTDISQLSDAIYIETFDARVGGDVNIEVKLKNAQAATAYNFDLVLPEGVTIAKDSNGKPIDALSDRHVDHSRTLNEKGNNIYSFATLSGNSEALTGNDGAIRLVTLHVADGMAEGSYPIEIKNASYSLTDGTLQSLENTTTSITVENYLLGDVNGNNGVDIGDAVTIVNYLVGKPTTTFVEKAADTNKNNQVDIGDAVTIVNYLVGKTANLSRKMIDGEKEPQ